MHRRQLLKSSIAAAVTAGLGAGQPAAAALRALTTPSTDIEAKTLGGGSLTLERAAVQELRDALRGLLLLPGAEGYDVARRVLNPDIDRYPALVVQPTGVADIQRAVKFASERELLLAVKCGGHSMSGKSTCDGGMQLDLSAFRHVRVDPQRKIAAVAGGSLLGELDHETMAHSLVTTAGTVSHTGVGGLTLGGGMGRVGRRFGLALDNVRAYDIVTADGQLRRAAADDNPDLYWGLRGGGGNFGVVTQFEFALHPMERQVTGGEVIFPLERAKDVLSFYADFTPEAPRELYADLNMAAPPGVPPVIMINVCYSGDDPERALAPLRKLGKPLQDTIRTHDYVALQRATDDTDPRTGGAYMKSGFVHGITDRLIDDIVKGFQPHPERAHVLFFQHAGGAIADVAGDATAFAHRDATHDMATLVFWSGEDRAPHVEFIKDYWASLEPHTRGQYVNSTSLQDNENTNLNFLGNHERLQSIKRRYDPANQFRLNANVRPEDAAA